jgi:hypothetical protein
MASGDFSRNSIVAERNEFRMTKVVIKRPFKELDHRDQFRLKPAAFLHILGRQALAPSAFPDSGRFLNGHLEIDRPAKFENTVRREAGVKPFRIRPAYIRPRPS